MFAHMPRLRPREEREEARRLRAGGMPFKRIAKRLGIPVSTVHCWSRDIELSPEQMQFNLRGPRGPQSPEHIARRTATWRRKNRARRESYQQEGRDRAREGDALHQAGCMLYWAEGAKDRNQLKFANSDVAMVSFFLRFLRECFDVRPEDCRVRLNVYTNNGITLEAVERHWLEALELPATSVRGHIENHYPTSSSGKKRRKLPYGVCTITVARSTQLVQHIYGAIQEYGGFEEPRWLDGPPRKSQAGRRRKLSPEQELDEAA
jgi:hypothetical protein